MPVGIDRCVVDEQSVIAVSAAIATEMFGLARGGKRQVSDACKTETQ